MKGKFQKYMMHRQRGACVCVCVCMMTGCGESRKETGCESPVNQASTQSQSVELRQGQTLSLRIA